MLENVYGHRKRLEFIVKVFESSQPKHILDVGCGTGEYITRPIGALGYNILGIDVDSASIQKAKQQTLRNNIRFAHFAPSDFPKETFDVVICSEVLEHLHDPLALLKKIHRVLEHHGLLILTTPNGYGWFEFEKFLYDKLQLKYAYQGIKWMLKKVGVRRKHEPKTLIVPQEPHTLKEDDVHLQHFTLRRLKSLFQRTGFSLIQQHGSTVFSGPFTGDLWHRSPRFIHWNAKIADALPLPLVSGWYFVLKKL